MYSVFDNVQKSTKFSFSISKKNSKSSVERNKLRRWGYSVITKHIKEIKPGFLCFFSFKKGSVKTEFQSLENEILGLLSVSGVIS